nr:zinc finger protein 707 isoform X4 [Globicephala melas]
MSCPFSLLGACNQPSAPAFPQRGPHVSPKASAVPTDVSPTRAFQLLSIYCPAASGAAMSDVLLLAGAVCVAGFRGPIPGRISRLEHWDSLRSEIEQTCGNETSRADTGL